MTPFPLQALQNIRVLSLALNLPGPAALLRLRAMGAQCEKIEPPAPAGAASTPAGAGVHTASADPMALYSPAAYAVLHQGIAVWQAHLKTPEGQERLHAALARADVLLTSFRPSALEKLGLGWPALQQRHPRLSLVRIVGATGARAEEAGHDLTYQGEAGLLPGMDLPASLYADMGGALAASEAVLQALLWRAQHGHGVCQDVALADAAHWLALPRQWGLTLADGDTGGAHAGYRVYACRDGRVAVAALEPHFAQRLYEAAGLPADSDARDAATRAALAGFFAGQSRAALDALAQARDIPLLTLA